MSVPQASRVVEDPAVPAVGLLLGAGRAASELVEEALADEGATVQVLHADHVSYRPGRRIVVSYEAELGWPDGSVSDDTIVVYAGSGDPPEGSIEVAIGDTTAGVWRLPADPYLPGLKTAEDPEWVRKVLDDLGAPAGPVRVRRVSYWPRTRAVVEVTAAQSKKKVVFRPDGGLSKAPPMRLLYMKVTAPEEVEPLYRVHRDLAAHLPVPACYGCLEDLGILLLEAKSGRTLYDCVRDGVKPVPDGNDLIDLLDVLGGLDVGTERTETSTEVARRYADLLRTVAPAEADRVDRLMEWLGEDDPEDELVTSHGDFHEVQLLVDQGRISALLDVDDVGPGYRVDDLAMMAGRIWYFAKSGVRGSELLERYQRHLLEVFRQVVDPEELHRRIVGILTTHATSPFRNQERRWPREVAVALQMAEDWIHRPVVG